MLYDIMEYLVLLDTVLIAVITGAFGIFAFRQKRRDDAFTKRAEERKEESLLSIKLQSANVALGIATAMAMQRCDKCSVNGYMEEALAVAKEARTAYEEYKNNTVAEKRSNAAE